MWKTEFQKLTKGTHTLLSALKTQNELEAVEAKFCSNCTHFGVNQSQCDKCSSFRNTRTHHSSNSK